MHGQYWSTCLSTLPRQEDIRVPAPAWALMLFRGLTAALMGQPAAGIEVRHPHLTRTAKAALQPLLGFPPISTRMHEVTNASTASKARPSSPSPLHSALPMCLLSCFAIRLRRMCWDTGLAGLGGGCACQAPAVPELPGGCAHTSCRDQSVQTAAGGTTSKPLMSRGPRSISQSLWCPASKLAA